MKMILKVADNEEVVGLLSFGSQVRVVQPEALRQKVMDEARKVFSANS